MFLTFPQNLVSVPEKYIAMPDRQEIKEEFTAVKRDLYMGDHILQVIYKLRKRLGWPSEGIQFGEQPNEPETIDTMKKVLDDDGEFLYCLPEHHGKLKARYNPYNLKVVQAEVVKSCSEYYTVSASYVTQVRLLRPLFFTLSCLDHMVLGLEIKTKGFFSCHLPQYKRNVKVPILSSPESMSGMNILNCFV